jgi:uncharacterized protein with NAD-binding domain and iron-sulfur cluster
VKRVTIFGGGIAGLTAAHELAERGFAVQLIEQAASPDDEGRPQLSVGGLAQTQYCRVPRGVDRTQLEASTRGAAPREAQGREAPAVRTIDWGSAGDDVPTREGREALAQLARELTGPLASYSVILDGPTARAHFCASCLVEADVARDRILDGDARSGPGVTVRLAEAVLPGEHGFRFFPKFYRHLADTMRRTRVAAAETAHDRLVPVPTQLYVRPGHPPAVLRRAPPTSLSALRREVESWLSAVGFSPRDLAIYALRLLRFATSSSRRRANEYETLTWWEFATRRRLDGGSGDERLGYGPAALEFLRHAPRALVAMDPEHSDARTQGNMLLQLVRDAVVPDADPIDATLDGPTSSAWLEPWRRYLESLGVRFFHGRLLELGPPSAGERASPRVTPHVAEVSPGGLDGYESEADYYVVALDLIGAHRATERVAEWGRNDGVDVGVPGEVQKFALELVDPGAAASRRRDPVTETGLVPWDRLQTLTGVQLYFGHRVELSKGYVYFTGSPWALTSIGQSFHWRRRPTLADDACISIHSVDVGHFDRAAWRFGKEEMVAEVLRQVRAAIAGDGAGALPAPLWYHVDSGLEFSPNGGALCANRTPYLINVAGDWRRRPGADPVDPRRPSDRAPLRTNVLWQPAQGGYAIHFGQVVFAGTYLRTFTRLTSMESANESARHAVNAVLAHAHAALVGEEPKAGAVPRGACPTTRLGDYCDVWNPEENELDELSLLRAVDDDLAERGQPHLFDILDIDQLPETIAPSERDVLRASLAQVEAILDRELAGETSGLDALMSIVRDALV